MLQQTAETTAVCMNCGAALQGRYCHRCGQKAVNPRPTVRDLFHEIFHEFTHFEGKTFQTLKRLAFSPGALTNEFLAGRRAGYISPFRLYLTCSVLFFALAALAPQTTQSAITVRYSSEKDSRPPAISREELQHRISETFLHNMPRAMFVLMPLFAFLTWAFYRKRQPYYIAHVYHAVHLHAFAFLMMAVWIVLALGEQYGRQAARLASLALIPYYYVGLSRVFAGSILATIVKGTIIGVLYSCALAGAMLAGLYIVLRAL